MNRRSLGIVGTVAIIFALFASSTVKADEFHCTINSECPQKNCKTSMCIEDLCVYSEVKCELPTDGDPCVTSIGCDAFNDQCRYERVSCDDGNPCTKDVCSRDSLDGEVICLHESNGDDDNCEDTFAHKVYFDNRQNRQLKITSNEDASIGICHSTKMLVASKDLTSPVVVLSFDDYKKNGLHKRGTCDNLIDVPTNDELHNRVFYVLQAQPELEGVQCSEGHRPGLHLDGVFSELVWSENNGESRLVDLGGGQLHLNAQVEGFGTSEGFGFAVNAYFDRDYSYTPLKQLSDDCYARMNIDVKRTWQGYKLRRGRLTALSKSLYDGLIIDLVEGSMQTGYGANAVSMNNGMWASFTWTVVNQPHDLNLHFASSGVVRGGDMRGDINIHRPKDTAKNLYCDLFNDEGEAMVDTDRWVMTREEDLSGSEPSIIIEYCANFTIEDLLRCRDNVDKYAPLFTRVNNEDTGLVYIIGSLYHTVVEKPEACSSVNDELDETFWSRTSYDLAFALDSSSSAVDIQKAEVSRIDVDFEVRWLENIWLCCTEKDAGNLQVHIETRTHGHQLVNPRVMWYGESGVSLVFIDGENVPCAENIDNVCVQQWTLRSYDAGEVVDFSSEHLLSWTTVDNGMTASTTMYVLAKHLGNQDHLDNGRITVDSKLYKDRAFTEVYTQDVKQKLLDQSHLFGLVCLNEHRHLDIFIQEVMLCYTIEDQDSLGINSLSCDQEGVEQVVVYSRDDESLTKQEFELLYDPPSTTHCEGFTFKVKAYSNHFQRLRIRWSTQEAGGEGGLIEMYNDDNDDGHHGGWHWQNDNSQGFYSHCAAGWYYNVDVHECRPYEYHDGGAWIFFLILVALLIGLCVCSWKFCHERFDSDIMLSQRQSRYRYDEEEAASVPAGKIQQGDRSEEQKGLLTLDGKMN
ncbi:MAG: hypothetical protein BVN35_06020 [Proteobacteria bacterium ST_bin11]|nr:MAG: hypothetical protein BVN35_06020 [Proteobacteria bacterium ST_bin11]